MNEQTGSGESGFGSISARGRAGLLCVALIVAALVGATFVFAATPGGNCGYGGSGYGNPAYCQPSGSGIIGGQVRQEGTGAPLQYASVTVRDVVNNTNRIATTDRDGVYTVPFLPASRHTVQVSRYGHATRWYDGADVVGDATVIDLPIGGSFRADVRLAVVGPAITGTATDAVTGLPVAGVCVMSALAPTSPGVPIPPPAQLPGSCAGAFSGPTGQYAIGGFPPGSFEYVLQVTDPRGQYWTEYYEDKFTADSATRVMAPAVADVQLSEPSDTDGDGEIEPPGYDGNDDGIPDDAQQNVTTLPAAEGGALVTIAVPETDYSLGAVQAIALADAPPLPPGVDPPVGIFGFTVEITNGATAVDVVLTLPPGTNPTSYLKLQDGAWVDFTANVTIVGDTVTLHLVDGGAGDADGVGVPNGTIVDPGAAVVGYSFSGFLSPTGNKANKPKAGSTIPVKWRITDADGAPVTDPASFVGLTSAPCGGGPSVPAAPPGSSGLTHAGSGNWQVDWKTEKGYAGQCRTLTLALADGGAGRTVDVQFK